ncbi:10134_t:CDS:2, partial [Racocetra persica]
VTHLFQKVFDISISCLSTAKQPERERYEMISKNYFAVRFNCKPLSETKDWIISKLARTIFRKGLIKKNKIFQLGTFLIQKLLSGNYQVVKPLHVSQDWLEIELLNLDIDESNESDIDKMNDTKLSITSATIAVQLKDKSITIDHRNQKNFQEAKLFCISKATSYLGSMSNMKLTSSQKDYKKPNQEVKTNKIK